MKNKTIPEISLDDAEILSHETDYADAAIIEEGNEINWADASFFFLEGYNHARKLLNK
jgi:hypothetical protein